MPGVYSWLYIPSDDRIAKCQLIQDRVNSVRMTEALFLPSSARDRSICVLVMCFKWIVSSYLLLYNKPLKLSSLTKFYSSLSWVCGWVGLSWVLFCCFWVECLLQLQWLAAGAGVLWRPMGRTSKMVSDGFFTHRAEASVILHVVCHPLGLSSPAG